MANEKSRNHDTGGGKGGASKNQGKTKDQGGAKSDDEKQDAGKAAKPDSSKA
jgi:hypothetical protein